MTHKDLRREFMLWIISKDIYTIREACSIANIPYESITNQLNGRTSIKLGSFMELVQAIDEKYTINKEFKIVRR